MAHRMMVGGTLACLLLFSGAAFPLADAAFPVTVITQINDGSPSPNCDQPIQDEPGGPPEVTLDLDNDGIQDICLGSNSTTCANPINLDCSASSLGNGSDCSEQGSVRLMDSELTAAANDGVPVGPNFDNTADSITVPVLGQPLVIGFRGVSSDANLTGYFELQINDVDGTNCSFSFGNAYVDDGVAGINYGETPVPPEPPGRNAVGVPTLPVYALLMTIIGLVVLARGGIRPVGKRR